MIPFCNIRGLLHVMRPALSACRPRPEIQPRSPRGGERPESPRVAIRSPGLIPRAGKPAVQGSGRERRQPLDTPSRPTSIAGAYAGSSSLVVERPSAKRPGRVAQGGFPPRAPTDPGVPNSGTRLFVPRIRPRPRGHGPGSLSAVAALGW